MELTTVGEGNNEEEETMTKLYLLRQNKEKDIKEANIIPINTENKKIKIKKKSLSHEEKSSRKLDQSRKVSISCEEIIHFHRKETSTRLRRRQLPRKISQDSTSCFSGSSDDFQSNILTVVAEIYAENPVDDTPFVEYPHVDIFEKERECSYEEGSIDFQANTNEFEEFSSGDDDDDYYQTSSPVDVSKDEATNDDEQKRIMAQHQFMVGLIWSFAGMYSVLTNNSGGKCNVREDPMEKFQIMSIFMSLIFPLVFGPISSFILIFHTNFSKEEHRCLL